MLKIIKMPHTSTKIALEPPEYLQIDQNTPKNDPKKLKDHQDDQNTLKNSKMTKFEGICPSKNIVKKLDWLEAYQ